MIRKVVSKRLGRDAYHDASEQPEEKYASTDLSWRPALRVLGGMPLGAEALNRKVKE